MCFRHAAHVLDSGMVATMRHASPRRWSRAALAVLILLPVLASSPVSAENFVQNGDLARGGGNAPEEWRTDKWDQSAGATEFMWRAPNGDQPGQAGIKSVKPNDARFVQDLHVREQSWYHITGKIRTENVGQAAIGAYLSLMEGFQNSEIAEILGISLDTVKIRLHRARDRLRKELGTGCNFFRDERNEFACDRKP